MTPDTPSNFTRARSKTGLFVASAIWAAATIVSAYICSTLLSIPGAAGASFFWLPQIFMVTAAIWFGWRGWVAAAVGTFLGGALAGNPLAINIAQNPIPAFLANTFLLWVMFKTMGIRLPEHGRDLSRGMLVKVLLAIAGIIALAMAVGYVLNPLIGKWGYLVVLAVTLLGFYVFNVSGLGSRVDKHLINAVLAVVVTSIISAVMGAVAWATIGEMGASAYSIVLPGWAMGDIVAGILGLAVLWGLTAEMRRRGLSVY
ncbi:MAG: hypothetical protein ACKO63_05045 [Nodosilinea sp.]